MGDKDSNILFGKPELFFCEPDGEIKPIGEAVNDVTFETEDEPIHIPTKSDFSVSFEVPSLSENFKDLLGLKPVDEAQVMIYRLRDYQALWRKYYGMGMRKERRKIERNFDALAHRLALHCKMYNITISKK